MADDYNPVDHRPPEKVTLSAFAVFTHLTKATLGSGILFMPKKIASVGWLGAVICSAFFGLVVTHCAYILVGCSQVQCKRERVPTLDFAETVEASFKNGPPKCQRFSKPAKLLVNILICFIQYQTVIIFTIYISDQSKEHALNTAAVAVIFKELAKLLHIIVVASPCVPVGRSVAGTHIFALIEHVTQKIFHIRYYIVGFFPILCLQALIPNLNYLTPCSILGGIAFLAGTFLVIYHFLDGFPDPGRLNKFTEWQEVSAYCAVYLYAIYNFSLLMPLENAMKEPHKMGFVLVAGMIGSIIIVVTFGFLGYNKYPEPSDTIMSDLPLNTLLTHAARFAITCSVFLTYALHLLVPVSILWPMLSKVVGEQIWKEGIFRLSGVFVTSAVAFAVPQMLELLSLFSALSFSTVILAIPVLIELTTRWTEAGTGYRLYLGVKNFLILVLWITVVIFGTVKSTNDIIAAQTRAEKNDTEPS